MSGLRDHLTTAAITPIGDYQVTQSMFDSNYWLFTDKTKEVEDYRHVLYHLMKLTTKIAVPLEEYDHTGKLIMPLDIRPKIVADLLFWAFHLANRWELNAGAVYLDRLAENMDKYPDLPAKKMEMNKNE